jgi:hypothetical protein
VVGWQKIFISGNIDGVVEGQRLKVKGIESKTFNLQFASRTVNPLCELASQTFNLFSRKITMKKMISSLFLTTFSVLLLILFNHAAVVSAQAELAVEGFSRPGYRLAAETGSSILTSSDAFTIYLPIVLVPTPRKGVGVVASPACADLQSLRASWYFNWGPTPDSTCSPADAAKFVPRISNAAGMASLDVAVANAQASGWLIGFNEPNLPWQGNMSPAQGAVLWRQIELTALPAGVKLVSPAPNPWPPGSPGDPYGHQWLWAMVDEYQALYGQKPYFDALGWHTYGYNATEIINFLTARRSEALSRGYDVPFWVLEYAGNCLGSMSGNQTVMAAVTPWFNATPWIDRYAWFANRLTGSEPNAINHQNCSLVNPYTGALTPLGQVYQGY